MDDGTIPLAAGFEVPSREAWRALVERSLKGAPFESLVSRTADGLEIEPLYADGDAEGRLTARAGEGGWDVRSVASHPDPRQANVDMLDDLAPEEDRV